MNALLERVWGKDRVLPQVRGLAPSVGCRRLPMAVNFQAFVDESFTAEEFVMGGHIAPAESWVIFAKRWEELLPLGTVAKNGKPHFKMSEMASNAGRMSHVPAFYRAIEESVTCSISCKINLPEFERAKERVLRKMSLLRVQVDFGPWSNPYFFVFRVMLDQFHLAREQFRVILPLDEQIDFIFDNRSEKKAILNAWDQYISEAVDENVRALYGAAPRFEDDQKFLPLQGADLWAWWVREWYEEDSADIPDKLRKLDFGTWRGKSRPIIVLSANEDHMVTLLESVAVSEFARDHGNLINPNE
jgi:hypothetical protein